MEHIREALVRSENNHVQESSDKPLENTYMYRQSSSFEYTHTRVVDVDECVLNNNRILNINSTDEITDIYRMLRTKVLQKMKKNKWNALAVTSTSKGEGKTVTAINMAISFAMEINQTVLLVDFNLRAPAIHKYFDFKPESGLSDYIINDTPLDRIMVNPGIERLVVLPGGHSVMNSSELLSSPEMLQMVEEIKSRYPSRYIIFDLPPLLSTDDALSFSPYVDATLIVIEDGCTKAEDLVRACDMLKDFNLIGSVLNKSVDTKYKRKSD